MDFEKRTGKQRQVLRDGVVICVQDQWKVQCGFTYTTPDNGPRLSPADEFVHASADGPIYIPCKLVWRDLTSVTEEEAKKDST